MRERELESLNDHLARLLAQADELVREWQSFGEQVRASVEAQVAQLDQHLARAVEQAAHGIAPRATQALSREIERLRAELNQLRAPRERTGWRRHLPLIAVVLLVVANGLLVVNLLRPQTPVPLLIDTGR